MLPDRHGSSEKYRYGFQGQEKDDELKGEGNSLNYTFRMHDPRVGRFFAVDPLMHDYPELTPYQFSSNNTTWMREYEGLEGLVATGMPMGDSGHGHSMIVSPQMAAKMPLSAKSAAVDVTPYLGTVKGIYEAFTGVDTVTGEPIPLWARALNLIPFFKPIAKLAKPNKITVNTASVISKVNKLKPCGCFTAGTQVYTEEGYKNIEDVKVGDKVWAYNDKTSVLELKEVIDTFTRDFTQVYKIHFGNEVLEATHEHPFFIGGKWLKVGELKVGDSLTLYDATTTPITKIEFVEGNFKVYNFTVDEFHTYYVSKQNVLVHNGNPCTFLSKKTIANLPSISVVAKQANNLQPDGKTLNFVIDDNLIKVDGKPYTGAKDFVITENGALLLGNGHYHLSGNAAKVKGAGEVNIVNGKIQDVTNNSGHYQPTKANTEEMVDVFKKEKIATDDIMPLNGRLPKIDKN